MKKKRLGKGAFSTAYLLEDGETVELISQDPVKECMALGWFPESRLFPAIEQIRDYGPDGSHKVYHMRYYNRTRGLKAALCPHDWKLYQLLRQLLQAFGQGAPYGYDHWREQFETLPDEFEDEREALLDALDACANYGPDVTFEISPRNVAVEDGRLVLLDCFFMADKLDELRNEYIDSIL